MFLKQDISITFTTSNWADYNPKGRKSSQGVTVGATSTDETACLKHVNCLMEDAHISSRKMQMAVGMDDRVKTVDAVINILERCRQIAKPGPSCPEKQIASATETLPNSMPDGSLWPHCQHYLSEDDPLDPLGQSIELVQYKDETNLTDIMRLMTKDLSEPYSIYTYRFFVHIWPELCILAFDKTRDAIVGAVVGKVEIHSDNRKRGYIAMLAIDASLRRQGLGTKLVSRAIRNMQSQGCDEVYLETEVDNLTAQGLYSKLGFIRDKRLIRYYLNGKDAFRLKLFFTMPSSVPPPDYC